MSLHKQKVIKGIENLGRSCKLLLYADDIVFTLHDPVTSVCTLSKLLAKFREVSGYRINDSKFVLTALNVGQRERDLTAPWKLQVRYFEVKITSTLATDTLIALNINPLIKKTQKQCENWQSLGTSWFDKVAAVKMKILPQFIFNF